MEKNWQERGREVISIEIEGLKQLGEQIDASFSKAVNMLAACEGRVIISGIGKSGLIGRKMAATFSSTGTPAFFLHPVEGAHGDLGSVREQDLLIAISYSGNSVELNAILPALKSLGLPVIAMTSGLHSPLGRMADIVLDCSIPKEACPNDLAPTTSTTATLALGDALAMCLIEAKSFTASDFKRFHPGGSLGQRLMLSVKELMHMDEIPLVNEDASLGEALIVQDAGGLGAVMICDKSGRLKGILTDGDIRSMIAQNRLDKNLPVKDCMIKNPTCAKPSHSAAELMDMMEAKEITVLPVLDVEDKLIGVLHLHDLLGKGQISFADSK